MYAAILAITLNAMGGLFSAPSAPALVHTCSKIDQKKAVLTVFESEEKRRETKWPTLRARL